MIPFIDYSFKNPENQFSAINSCGLFFTSSIKVRLAEKNRSGIFLCDKMVDHN